MADAGTAEVTVMHRFECVESSERGAVFVCADGCDRTVVVAMDDEITVLRRGEARVAHQGASFAMELRGSLG